MEKLCGYVFKTMRVDIYWDIYRYTFHKSSNLRRVWLCFILCLDIPYPYRRSLYVIFVCLVTQTCSTLRLHGPYPIRLLCPWGFFRKEYWIGLSCPPPGDLPHPGIEPRFPSLHVDSLLTEPPRK